jgi:hypothetical protein
MENYTSVEIWEKASTGYSDLNHKVRKRLELVAIWLEKS